MTPESLALMRSPHRHEALREVEVVREGRRHSLLVGVESGLEYPITDGIPHLVDPARIGSLNNRYQRFYNRIARLYDPALALAARMAGGTEAQLRAEYLSALELVPDARLLEVSVGTGANLQYLPAGLDCHGVDLSLGMLARCQRRLDRLGRSCTLVLADAEELPYVDGAFEAVLHVGGINAFDDRARALSEMVRVAKPGSRIVVVDETARLIRRLGWLPGARRMLEEHGDRFEPPEDLLPSGVSEVQTREIVNGDLYCLTFRAP